MNEKRKRNGYKVEGLQYRGVLKTTVHFARNTFQPVFLVIECRFLLELYRVSTKENRCSIMPNENESRGILPWRELKKISHAFHSNFPGYEYNHQFQRISLLVLDLGDQEDIHPERKRSERMKHREDLT